MKFFLAKAAAVAIAVTAFAAGQAGAQALLQWSTPQNIDTGVQPSIAVTPSGLVVETHRSDNPAKREVWYRVGKVKKMFQGDYYISWAKSEPLNYPCEHPTVAITKEGYVLMVCTRSTYPGVKGTVMRYFVGTLNPDGENNQTIDWKIKDALFDTGQDAKFAFTHDNRLVEVHESANNNGLYYRIGHLNNPAQGDFKLVWDSLKGNDGVQYDSGANPTISVNNSNQIIESHQEKAGSGYVEYRRGTLGARSITFASGGIVYDKDSNHPDVALTNDGLIVQAAATMSTFLAKGHVTSRTGQLNGDPTYVNWSKTEKLGWSDWPGEEPSIATNGDVAVSMWTGGDRLFSAIALIP